ncbi:MAG: HAD-IIIA family hydrolase [Chloroflexota bacterium]
MSGPMPTALFLDRDGVLNRKAAEGAYVTSPDEFEWLPGALSAMAALHRQGVRLFVMTNQRGVARGAMSEGDLAAIHDRMRTDLLAVGVALEGVYACMHEGGSCDCRKPGIGLFIEALHQHPDLDRTGSAVVGDAISDLEAAARLEVDAYAIVADGERELLTARAEALGVAVAGWYGSLEALVRDGFGLRVA